MKLKFKFNEQEKHFLNRLLAIFLCLCLFGMAVLCLTYIELKYQLIGIRYLGAALLLSLIIKPITLAIWKYFT